MDIERFDYVDADHVAAGTASFLAQAIEAKQPTEPGEMTRKWFETAMKRGFESEELWSRILSDRAATEARVRAELERELDNLKFLFKASESDRAVLRTTIADLEKRLENAVEIPHESKWPAYSNHIWVVYTKTDHEDLLHDQDTIAAIPRPTPAKLTPEQMAREWIKAKGYNVESWSSWNAGENALMHAMLYGKSIETLYAEIKGGE